MNTTRNTYDRNNLARDIRRMRRLGWNNRTIRAIIGK